MQPTLGAPVPSLAVASTDRPGARTIAIVADPRTSLRPSLDLRSLTRPRWIAGHLIALIAVISFVNLGFWQLRRLELRQTFNATVSERLAEDPAPIAVVLGTAQDPADVEYRRVLVGGVFLSGEEVILQARTLNGRSGHHLLTPLAMGDGVGIIVDRGWVPIDVQGPPVFEAAPPLGTVTLTGWLRASEQRGRFGPSDPENGALARIGRVDLERLDEQTSVALLPVYLVLEAPQPGEGGLPLLLPRPELSQGPHLAYAIQWFLFALIVAVGYPVLLYRVAQRAGISTVEDSSARVGDA